MKQKFASFLILVTCLLLYVQVTVARQDTDSLTNTSFSITYVYLSNGKVDAFPQEYISDLQNDGKNVLITDLSGVTYTYALSEATISENAPTDLPRFTDFKFNNKFNDMLMVDAEGKIVGDSAIKVTVGGIGKRLVPSFELSDDSAIVFVGNDRQISKKTSRRYESPVTYTVTWAGYNMLQRLDDGTYAMCPFGRDYQVTVDYLCDHPTTEYGVPIIRITTDNGTDITSRDYYWTGKISIDGAGYYPDMEEMAMSIKGRGNTSWTDYSKKPYRIKFGTKQKPLGMKAGKNWNLIASAQNGSMTSNVVGSRIAEMIETDGANHFIPVELYINGTYRGSYCLTEKVGFSNNSIDLDDESNATLLELDTYSYDFRSTAKFNNNRIPVTIHYPDFTDDGDVTNLTKADIQTNFDSFITALAKNKDISEFVDYISLARFLMLNDVIQNYELMHPKSFFCYNKDILADSVYHFGPVWDFDWGYGYEANKTYFKSDATYDYYTSALSKFEVKDFVYKLRYCGEEMNKQYYRVWTDFMNNHLDDLCEYCVDYYNVASKSLAHNDTKWYTNSNYKTITDNSITWIRKRASWVYNYLSNTLGYADKGYLEPDEEPQGIETVTIDEIPVRGIFTVQGQRVSGDYQSLPKGVYIISGKKILKQ